MGRYLILIIAALSLLLNIFFGYTIWRSEKNIERRTQNVEQRTRTSNHTVQRIIDGDTFDIGNGDRIRLYGINAPEYPKGCMGKDAKERLESLLVNREVQIEVVVKDNFGRQVSLVSLDDLLINEVMVEEGYVYYEKSKPEREESLVLEKAEQKAMLTGRGVWSSLCETKQDGCVIKGNYREADHTRLYHTVDCYNYDRITVKPGTSDRWFCTEEEAKKAGFRKSADCPIK
jgi:endonuclease YncB( thermonuclease family)